ncbi:hypothetical protein B0H65DRAFT_553620 [Neurospora tetraspora]|uniref:Uncharacterized protein n=1 Tax=Neurospora tetraspora TaxID=94610 RepID=A0AAE0J0J7_9PEZI|nr:hypothetical protein B0H65DRAFT_553620 [Neurospora tetraspora]
MYVDSQFRGVANDDILTDEQLLRNSERAASVEDLEATIKFEWDALERQDFLVALASAPIGSSKEEARKKLTAQIKFAEEIGWQDVVIKDEAAVDEARGGNTSLEARFWEFATPSKYATPAKRPASSTSPGMQRELNEERRADDGRPRAGNGSGGPSEANPPEGDEESEP